MNKIILAKNGLIQTTPRFIVVRYFVLASGYVYSSWWKTSPPRNSTKIWMFDYNV